MTRRPRSRGFCKVCAHPERAEMERLHAEGTQCPEIAAQFAGVSHDSIWRHMKNHAGRDHQPRALKLADDAAAVAARSKTTLEYWRAEAGRQERLANIATERGDIKAASAASRALTHALDKMDAIESRDKARRAAPRGSSGHPALTTFYSGLRRTLLTALVPYGEARRAVSQALTAYERDQGVEVGERRSLELPDAQPVAEGAGPPEPPA